MGMGFSGGSLAVFTVLAPAGAVAFAIAAAFLLTHRSLSDVVRSRMNHALIAPLAVAWAGFIASATHLGTPANALHAVEGIGRSPLSNEVAAVVTFLFAAGVYWLYTYKVSYSRRLADLLAGASVVACAAMVAMMALAYSVPTVPSWDTWHTPANLCLSALTGGVSLGAAMMHAFRPETRRWHACALRILPVLIVLSTGMLAWHSSFLAGVSNNVANAADSVPAYAASIVAFLALASAGWFMQRRSSKAAGWTACALDIGGCLLVFSAMLIARLPFYASYLSAGF